MHKSMCSGFLSGSQEREGSFGPMTLPLAAARACSAPAGHGTTDSGTTSAQTAASIRMQITGGVLGSSGQA